MGYVAGVLCSSFTILNEEYFEKPSKKLKVRVGTHLFSNCIGNRPCGPCPGICIKLEKESVIEVVDDQYVLTACDLKEGYILVDAELNDNEDELTLAFVSNIDEFNGNWGIEEDFETPTSVSEALEATNASLTIMQGSYSINPAIGEFGGVIMSVKN